MQKRTKEKYSLGISGIRKIMVWIFIVGFWVLFYWHQSKQQKQPIKTKLQTEKNLLNGGAPLE
tara:strand:+ start:2646 stop:2834 length:189 start_codon:yes stop_codon:yes gene_type:complete